jgi:hypothetical protein
VLHAFRIIDVLSGLNDTTVSSPIDGAPLVYDTGTSKWVHNHAMDLGANALTTTSTVGRDADNFIGWGVDNSLAIEINGSAHAIVSITDGAGDNDKLVTQGYVDDATGSVVAGADTQVQYNNSGAFGADAGFTYDGAGGITLTGVVLAADGDVDDPAYSFSSESNTGMYHTGTAIGFAESGNLGGAIDRYGFLANDGLAAFPAFTFFDDLNTGFYRIASGNIGITLDNSLEYDFSKTLFDAKSNNITTTGTGSFNALTLTGDTSVISSAHEIDIKPNGDSDDYLQILTDTNQTAINFVGQNGKITADTGAIDFDDEDLTTTGDVAIGAAIEPLAALKIIKTGDGSTIWGIDVLTTNTSNIGATITETAENLLTARFTGDLTAFGADGHVTGVTGHGEYMSGSEIDDGNATLTCIGGKFTGKFSGTNTDNSSIQVVGLQGQTSGDIGTTGSTSHAGHKIDVLGTADNNYGLYILRVTNATTNYGIYDASGADWLLNSDNQKIILGATPAIGDVEIYYDNTQLIIDDITTQLINFQDNALTTTGTGTFGQIIDNGLTASLGVYTDGSKQLTSTAPGTGILGHWTRAGTVLNTANAGDSISITGNITTTTDILANEFNIAASGTDHEIYDSSNDLVIRNLNADGDIIFSVNDTEIGQFDFITIDASIPSFVMDISTGSSASGGSIFSVGGTTTLLTGGITAMSFAPTLLKTTAGATSYTGIAVSGNASGVDSATSTYTQNLFSATTNISAATITRSTGYRSTPGGFVGADSYFLSDFKTDGQPTVVFGGNVTRIGMELNGGFNDFNFSADGQVLTQYGIYLKDWKDHANPLSTHVSYDMWSENGSNWVWSSDNQKLILGLTQDVEIYYDDSQLIIDDTTTQLINFQDNALITTGTLGAGAATVTSLDAGSGLIQTTGDVQIGDDLLFPNVNSVINFGSGDITITYTANTLTYAGMSDLDWGTADVTTTGTGTFGGASSGQSIINSGLVVNEDSGGTAADDFRAETTSNGNAFVVDASADEVLINAVTKMGDGGVANFSEIEADGTLEFNGDATVWEDANIDLSPLQSGGTKPGFVTVASTNIRLLAYDVGEDVDGSLEIPHAYKLSSTITPHIHFLPTAAPTGTDNVRFELEYFVVDHAGVVGASATVNTGDIAIDTQWERYDANFGTFSHAALGGQIGFKVSRVAPDGAAYAGDAAVLTFGFHYEKDTVGSRQITTK